MSRKGEGDANAVAESAVNVLKQGLVHEKCYAGRQQARPSITEYIGLYYNRQRPQLYQGYEAPVVYETMHAALLMCQGKRKKFTLTLNMFYAPCSFHKYHTSVRALPAADSASRGSFC